MAMKPRLRRAKGAWVCIGAGAGARAESALAAYALWCAALQSLARELTRTAQKTMG